MFMDLLVLVIVLVLFKKTDNYWRFSAVKSKSEASPEGWEVVWSIKMHFERENFENSKSVKLFQLQVDRKLQ